MFAALRYRPQLRLTLLAISTACRIIKEVSAICETSLPETGPLSYAAMTDPFQPFDAPRRAPYQRPSEELHIPSSNTSANSSASRTAPYQHLPGPGNLVSLPPSINIHQPHYASQHVPFTSGPETHYPSSTGIPNSNAMAFSTLPGPLQPGRQIALPQISTSLQPPYAHGHSKSTSTGSGYAPQTPYDTPFSPLGLAEIRQDMAMMDDPPEPPQPHQSHSSEFQFPKNSNYNAPWPIYALDWCKWPVLPGSHAGRVAIGSYVEDNHNYVCQAISQFGSAGPLPPNVIHRYKFLTQNFPISI